MTLQERLSSGPVICAEGYLFELERRGYLQAGAFVPEVVLERPEKVAQLHEEFVHAGSDVVEAFTYYAHREKLRVIGRAGDLEPLNRGALEIARQVAAEHGALLAGNVCNTNVFEPDDAETVGKVRDMFAEQVRWAADAGVDFVIGETFWWAQEALLALQVIADAGLPAVITLAPHRSGRTREDWSYAEACRRLADAGAVVVGLNCIRGPQTMAPLLGDIVGAVDVPVAALPVPYRTDVEQPTFQSLRDPVYEGLPGGMPFPTALDPFTCNRYEMADFATAARALGVRYFGVCCGAAPHHVRAVAEALGRRPPASRFSADMSKHAFLGTDRALAPQEVDIATRL
ncbi:MAG TPA: homocysteine S-methyltransferase family protein [Euzebyales bacterium]|nr:homocysteine S-methyltransferase family protein [Euzebyales bacterium]